MTKKKIHTTKKAISQTKKYLIIRAIEIWKSIQKAPLIIWRKGIRINLLLLWRIALFWRRTLLWRRILLWRWIFKSLQIIAKQRKNVKSSFLSLQVMEHLHSSSMGRWDPEYPGPTNRERNIKICALYYKEYSWVTETNIRLESRTILMSEYSWINRS